jgi:hypothetical protein
MFCAGDLSPSLLCCCQLPPGAVPLCDSLWSILICTVQHYTLRTLFEFGVSSLYRHDTTQSILFLVVVGQCWRLLSSRRLILVAKADGLPSGCSGHGCGPASSTIFLTSVSRKSLCESLEPQDFSRMWLLRTVRSRRWKNNFFVHFHVRRLIL